MKVNITLSNNETLNKDISKGTYDYIKGKLSNEDTVFSDYVKDIEIIK